MAMTAAEIAARRGRSSKQSVAKAQTVLLRPCVENAVIVGIAEADIDVNNGWCTTLNVEKDQDVRDKF